MWNFNRRVREYFLPMWQLRRVNTDKEYNSGLKFLNKKPYYQFKNVSPFMSVDPVRV
jgi:hypothetical protein